jgi:hypothetical protein
MLKDIKNNSPKFKDSMILTAWIVGILVIGGLLWFFTQDVRDNRMVRRVNSILIENNDSRRLFSRLPENSKSENPFQNYQRYTLSPSKEVAVIMSMYDNTVPAVCAAFLNAQGEVTDFVPLDFHSAQVMERMDTIKRNAYKTLIEEHEKLIRSGE